jgi:hypothetical protein
LKQGESKLWIKNIVINNFKICFNI